MAINKVVFGNEVKMDLTNDSVSADNLLEGETAHDRSGSPVVGTAKQGHVIQNDSGTALPQESALQFVGVYSEDDSTNHKTKVNMIREMTKAQMDALSTDAKKGVIHTTDEPDNPANPISAEDVLYGSGTVEDALNNLANVKFYKVSGTTGALNTEMVIPFPIGADISKLMIVGYVCKNTNSHYYSDNADIAIQSSSNLGVRVTVTGTGFVSQPITVLLAEI